MVPHGVFDQFGVAFGAKHFHHPVLVIRNRPGCHVKDVANFLHHLSFSQQLQHFTLSVGEAFVFLDQLLPF